MMIFHTMQSECGGINKVISSNLYNYNHFYDLIVFFTKVCLIIFIYIVFSSESWRKHLALFVISRFHLFY